MISHDLRATAKTLRKEVQQGTLSRRHMDILIDALHAWSDQVAELEERPVPAHHRTELPDDVVSLSDVRARRQAEAFVAQQMGRGPGGAA